MSNTKQSPSRSGAFDQAASPLAERFTQSIDVDSRLYRHDILGSIAHAKMLAEIGLISRAECEQIEQGLKSIEADIDNNNFPFSINLEDIHMHIEQALIERIGEAGRKLHTARSRNDQVSTAMRLWLRDQIDRSLELLHELQSAFVERCERDAQIILPAYTHLQRAQPVLAPHYWLAYCEKFQRDRERLVGCRLRVNTSPLGCGAVAGTSLPIDRQYTATQLGFDQVMRNSIDSSGDRDFVIEALYCWAHLGIHLSGWAEEWIIWASDEYSMLELPSAFCTGSSMMPQKINPDVLELIRGKSSTLISSLQALMILVKGLPTAYNRDLQEDKIHLFRAADTILACLEIAIPIVRETRLKTEKLASRLGNGFVDATTLMEYLIKRGESMRTAHHRVGELVHLARQSNCSLSQLKLEVFQQIDPTIDVSVYDVLGVENAVKAFCSFGSTGLEQVQFQVQAWRGRLATQRHPVD
ncbi:MAG TPA: argininosuccinate lyase [Pirellulaceae bacterium]|nr:argininosuccinate lyase [Pirellulaceae bacterium]HMO91355.1 argininosuccinate lyase [Pirellulaceae bacterium]HMP70253.1 argininosuccinate lyase [Pirellulaceae bacterium]